MRIKSIKINKEKKITWNITVQDNHNYYVEGVLVKNSEKPLPPYSCCNLLSQNMEKYSTNPDEYIKELEYIVPLITRLSDNVVEYELVNNLSPIEEQKWILEQTREIGLGITNIHGWLLKQDLSYASDEANKKVEHFFKHYAYNAFKASVSLADEKGNAPALNMLNDLSPFMNSLFFKTVVNEFYGGDYKKVKGLRNLALMSIAPSGCGAITNKIITDQGILSISDILKMNNINAIPESEKMWFNLHVPLKVKVKEGIYQDVHKIFYNGLAPTRTLFFDDGTEATFTLNHPLLVGESENTAKWVTVGDLKETDNIIQY